MAGMQRLNALLLGVIGCTAFAPHAPPRPSTAVAAKKKFKAAEASFGATPREKKRSEKPFKSQVIDAHNGFENGVTTKQRTSGSLTWQRWWLAAAAVERRRRRRDYGAKGSDLQDGRDIDRSLEARTASSPRRPPSSRKKASWT